MINPKIATERPRLHRVPPETPPAAVPATWLVENSLNALALELQEQETAHGLQKALEAKLSPDLVLELRRLTDAWNTASQCWLDRCVAEIGRHLPLTAPALPTLLDHAIVQALNDVGHCCTGRGELASVPSVPPGIAPRPPVLQLATVVRESDLEAECERLKAECRATIVAAADISHQHPNLPPEVSAHIEAYEDAMFEHMDATRAWYAAELARHFPGLAPALQGLWDHVRDEASRSDFSCCAGPGGEDGDDR